MSSVGRTSRWGVGSIPPAVWRLADHLVTGGGIVRDEGIRSLALNAIVVHGPRALTEYVVHERFGFPRWPSHDDLAYVWLDPEAVTLDFRSRPLPVTGELAVVGSGRGFWDRSTIRFEEKPVVRAIRDHFVDGFAWEDTDHVQRAIRRAARGLPAWNDCQTRADIERRCRGIDALFESMATGGYKTQQQLFLEAEGGDPTEYVRVLRNRVVPDELRVAIGRDGRIIRTVNGRHRVAIARLLGIDRIPAIVQIRHADYEGRPSDLPGVESGPNWASGPLVGEGPPPDHRRPIRGGLTKARPCRG